MKHLICFEILLVALCAFVAWYVKSPFTSDAVTIGLILVMIAIGLQLALAWIIFVIAYAQYLMQRFLRDLSMLEQD